jgi:RNA polymerase sigma factor (sigma-70 family)
LIALNPTDEKVNPVIKSGAGKDHAEPDSYLWSSFKNGNELAFTVLYKKYIQLLYNYGMSYCRDKDLVMDTLQELFARLWDRRTTVGEVQSVKAYLLSSFSRLLSKKKIAQNRFVRGDALKEGNFFELIPPHENTILESEQASESRRRIEKCMRSLSRRQREALFLKFNNSLSYEEVAAVMELQVESTYNLISKALTRLRESLKRTSVFYCLSAGFLFPFLY